MRTAISLPDPLLENARQRAAELGITLSAWLEEALRHFLKPGPLSPAPGFRLHTVRGRAVDPKIDLDRTSALVAAEDEETFGTGRC